MSNKLPPQFKQQDADAQQRQLQAQQHAAIMQTRLNMSQAFLNTLIGRLDVDLGKDNQLEPLVDMSIEFSNTLMIKLGIIVPNTKGVE